MAKKLKSGNKTDNYINVILAIADSARLEINEERLKELLGHPSKSQFYNYVNDLIQESANRPALLCKIKSKNGNVYKLHEKTWSHFMMARNEGEYLLECLKQVGHLIENNLMEANYLWEKESKKNIDRKFIYLSQVQGLPFSEERKVILQNVINSLLGDFKSFINYQGKFYTIFPLTLCQYRDELYLIARKDEAIHGPIRVFKLCRIEKIEISTENFKYPLKSKWDPKERYKETSGLILGEKKIAYMRVFGHAKKIIAEKKFFTGQLIQSTDEFDEYECLYTNSSEFLGQIFVYADEIQMIGPEELKEQFHKKLKSSIMLNINSNEIKKAS